jgi:hypothetical protein
MEDRKSPPVDIPLLPDAAQAFLSNCLSWDLEEFCIRLGLEANEFHRTLHGHLLAVAEGLEWLTHEQLVVLFSQPTTIYTQDGFRPMFEPTEQELGR